MSQTEIFKIQLEAELMKVVSGLETIAVQSPDSGDWVATPVASDLGNADENIEADAVEEWNERRALVAQLEIRYRNITRALEKIENGTYGICEISGEPIEEERLQANPAARTNLANIDRERELPL
jgi:RNA polymerase-binding transcription factor DksA